MLPAIAVVVLSVATHAFFSFTQPSAPPDGATLTVVLAFWAAVVFGGLWIFRQWRKP
jgi:hypothetical protein